MEPEIISQQISKTLEEIISKLKFIIEEAEYKLKAIYNDKEKHENSFCN